MALKKTLTIPLNGQEVHVSVDMRIIEIVERVYDANVDVVAAVILSNSSTIKLTQLAVIIAEWLTPGQLEELEIKRKDVKEAIYTASHEEIRRIVGCIQGACLFCRRHITEDELDELEQGNDLEDGEEKKEKPAPKKPIGSGKASRKRPTKRSSGA